MNSDSLWEEYLILPITKLGFPYSWTVLETQIVRRENTVEYTIMVINSSHILLPDVEARSVYLPKILSMTTRSLVYPISKT